MNELEELIWDGSVIKFLTPFRLHAVHMAIDNTRALALRLG